MVLVVAGLAASLLASLLASVAGFAPNKLLAEAGAELDAGAEVVVDAPVAAVVVAAEPVAWLLAAAPNKPPAGFGVDVSVEGLGAPPKRPPAVVVAAGVVAEAVVVAGLAPNSPPVVVVVELAGAAEVVAPPPKRPPDGAELGVEVAEAAGLAPNREVVVAAGVELPPWVVAGAAPSGFAPNSPPEVGAGAGADAGLAPKSPPAEALLPDCAAPPKRPPGVAEAVVLGWAEEAEVAAGLAPFPKRPDAPEDAWAPVLPNSPPAGLAASVGGAPAGVVDGKEKVGLAGVAAPVVAFPNKPDAGAAEEVAVEAWLALF